jgi:hypothetical protein
MDNILPLFGAFSALFIFFIGGLWLVCVVLWVLVPFTLFAIRKQVDQQALSAQRIEKQLGELLTIARTLRQSAPPREPPAANPPPKT